MKAATVPQSLVRALKMNVDLYPLSVRREREYVRVRRKGEREEGREGGEGKV